jgi:hypothetical protein
LASFRAQSRTSSDGESAAKGLDRALRCVHEPSDKGSPNSVAYNGTVVTIFLALVFDSFLAILCWFLGLALDMEFGKNGLKGKHLGGHSTQGPIGKGSKVYARSGVGLGLGLVRNVCTDDTLRNHKGGEDDVGKGDHFHAGFDWSLAVVEANCLK